jgi:Bromodomain associated
MFMHLYHLYVVLAELARSTKAFSELAGRTDPLLGDVIMAMVEMGELCACNFNLY